MTADQVRAAHERIDLLTEERDELRADVARLTAELAAAGNVIGDAAWQMNEAVSLLREARHTYLANGTGLAEEIDEALPAIDAALRALAAALDPGPGLPHGCPATDGENG